MYRVHTVNNETSFCKRVQAGHYKLVCVLFSDEHAKLQAHTFCRNGVILGADHLICGRGVYGFSS